MSDNSDTQPVARSQWWTRSETIIGSAEGCIRLGDGARADQVWTKAEFISICRTMLNDNLLPIPFLLAFRDKNGQVKFVRAKNTPLAGRIDWAWHTITGRVSLKSSIGFYPSNQDGMSQWGAMDFDAHDGDAARAQDLAAAACGLLRRETHFGLILEKSGSEGWHLFVFAEELRPIAEWTRFLKQASANIGAELKCGCCEIFPDETRNGGLPRGIRAPGTWNPKTDQIGRFFFHSNGVLFLRKKKEEDSPFLCHSISDVRRPRLNDRGDFYQGGKADWQNEYRISEAGTRHAKLKSLVTSVYRQVAYGVARRNAEAQYLAAKVQPQASLGEHMTEFEALWDWTAQRWLEELPEPERNRLEILSTETEREVWRILLNFAAVGRSNGCPDFPFSIQNVAERVGLSFQHISQLRRKFVDAKMIALTAPARVNRSAARFRIVALEESPSPTGAIFCKTGYSVSIPFRLDPVAVRSPE